MIVGVSLSGQLNIHRAKRISHSVSISRLFAILIAAAMLFAPFAMQSGSAMAAMPSDHHGEMVGKDHCEGQTTDKDSGSADKSCCAAMCTASALPNQAQSNASQFSRLLAVPGAVTLYRGVLSELSTPPPRVP